MENALTMEQGHTFAKHLGSSGKQFKAAQKKLLETLQKLQTKAPYKTAADHFNKLYDETLRCNSAEYLNGIIEDALAKANSLDKSGQW